MRILVVEDDKNIARILKKGLEEACFVVDLKHDGKDGLFSAITNDYDLVILDNMLPKKTGQEICEELRKKKDTPVIMLSVRTDVSNKVNSLNIGADDYLDKPFSFEELLARIKAVLRRPKKVRKKILRCSCKGVVLDTEKNTVTFRNKEVYLRRKEFMLLELLMKNKGQVVSRSMILEHVWDSDVDPFSNTIESHISNLRKKFKGGKGSGFIKTVSGRGYKVEE